jgi:hypothetical protein
MANEPTDQVTFAAGQRDTPVSGFIRRVRGRAERAAVKPVERYRPAIHRVVWVRLHDRRIRGPIESGDIGESVLAPFFVPTQAAALRASV